MVGLPLQDDVALCAEVLWYVGRVVDGDVGQSALVGFSSPVWRLRPFVPRDVVVLVLWWGRRKGEGLYPVQADGVFRGRVAQDVYALVPWYGVQVHVARDVGKRERLAQGRGAWGGAQRVMVLTPGVDDAVWGDVYSEGSDSALQFVGLDAPVCGSALR